MGKRRRISEVLLTKGMISLAAVMHLSVLLGSVSIVRCSPLNMEKETRVGDSTNTTGGDKEGDLPISSGTEEPLQPDPVEAPKVEEPPGPEVGINSTTTSDPATAPSQCLVSGTSQDFLFCKGIDSVWLRVFCNFWDCIQWKSLHAHRFCRVSDRI